MVPPANTIGLFTVRFIAGLAHLTFRRVNEPERPRRPGHATLVVAIGWKAGPPRPSLIVTINPLAPAAIFWNNRVTRSNWAVNRLDRKLT